MTNEEAKEIFLNRGFVNGLFDGDKWRQSIVVISKWLEQEPCEDCISREEVCDYIAEFVNHEYATDREREMVEHIIGGIQHLPSIQPKVIERDAISRKAAIDALKYVLSIETDGGLDKHKIVILLNAIYNAQKKAIEDLPSIQPKTDVLDKIRAEIEKTTSRYTISRERGAMGQVEWSDRLIKESEVLEIIDKYEAESEDEE
jgi:hypothetical protein